MLRSSKAPMHNFDIWLIRFSYFRISGQLSCQIILCKSTITYGGYGPATQATQQLTIACFLMPRDLWERVIDSCLWLRRCLIVISHRSRAFAHTHRLNSDHNIIFLPQAVFLLASTALSVDNRRKLRFNSIRTSSIVNSRLKGKEVLFGGGLSLSWEESAAPSTVEIDAFIVLLSVSNITASCRWLKWGQVRQTNDRQRRQLDSAGIMQLFNIETLFILCT